MEDQHASPVLEEKAEHLVPQFVVPLGSTLASLETTKERLLTNDEIIACRDKEPCIMLKPEDESSSMKPEVLSIFMLKRTG